MNIVKMSLIVVLIVAPSSVFGWTLVLYNTTAYPAFVGVKYSICLNDDVVVIQPGGQANVNAKECLVKEINVALGEIKQLRTPIGIINMPINTKYHIHWSVTGHRDFSATIALQPNGSYNINANYGTQLVQKL